MSVVGSERSRYSFLVSRRWAGLAALIAGFVALSVVLGFWQWDRFETRFNQAQQVEDAFETPPQELSDVLGPELRVGADQQWRAVTLQGRYLGVQDGLDHHTVLLRNRPVDGTAARHLIALFQAETDGGSVLVPVSRGWLADAEVTQAGSVPEPPQGPAQVVVRLRAAEQPRLQDRPDGQVYALDPAGLLEAFGASEAVGESALLDGYGAAISESPAAGQELGTFDQPSARWGLNLSYAIQWWIFAIGALVAIVVLARREAKERSEEDRPQDHASADPGAPKSTARRRRSAEDEEDAIIEAQLRP